MNTVRLLYGTTVPGGPFLSSDLLWKTQFKVHDPLFFCEFSDGRNVLLANELEYGRARKEAKNCSVELIEPFMKKASSARDWTGGCIQFLKERVPELMRSHSSSTVVVHGDIPCSILERLMDAGLPVTVYDVGGEGSLYPERISKTDQEISYITDVQRKLEKVVAAVVDILRNARVSPRGDVLVTKSDTVITSEYVREFMDVEFARKGVLAVDTIVACGDQGADPHCLGTGPLYAHTPIIVDVFPRSKENFYWADMTRTFFKGRPTTEAEKLYRTVLTAQCFALEMIHAGVNGLTIYNAVNEFFEKSGYHTGEKDGQIQGFPHGVGHGLGLDIHEAPRISTVDAILPEKSVVTAEPGLYYLGIGGVRIEDLVVVEKDGVTNLTRFPKELEQMIL